MEPLRRLMEHRPTHTDLLLLHLLRLIQAVAQVTPADHSGSVATTVHLHLPTLPRHPHTELRPRQTNTTRSTTAALRRDTANTRNSPSYYLGDFIFISQFPQNVSSLPPNLRLIFIMSHLSHTSHNSLGYYVLSLYITIIFI